MERINRKKSFLDLRFLLCSLFTLSPFTFFPVEISIRENFYSNSFSLTSRQKLTSLENLLDQASIREMAYKIIHPLTIPEVSSDTYLLNQYIQKFSYNYYYFFRKNMGDQEVQKINDFYDQSIRILFILAGI